MNPNRILQLLLIISLIFLFSCEKDFEFEEQKIILQSLVIEGQSPKIILARTLDAFPEYPFNIKYFDQPFYIDSFDPSVSIGNKSNISISVTCGDKVYKNFEMKWQDIEKNEYSSPSASSSIMYFQDNSLIAEPGKEYSIEIKEIPSVYNLGFNYLKSKTYIPTKIPVGIEQQNDILNSDPYLEESVYNFIYSISFDDPIDSKDYYYLTLSEVSCVDDFSMDTVNMNQLWQEYINFSFNKLRLTNLQSYETVKEINPEIPYLYPGSYFNGYLFTDNDFNGQTKNIRLILTNYTNENEATSYVVAELMHLSEEYYNYYLSIQKQWNSQQDIFSEPVQIYTNVENGLGVFAGASMQTQYIKVVSKPE